MGIKNQEVLPVQYSTHTAHHSRSEDLQARALEGPLDGRCRHSREVGHHETPPPHAPTDALGHCWQLHPLAQEQHDSALAAYLVREEAEAEERGGETEKCDDWRMRKHLWRTGRGG